MRIYYDWFYNEDTLNDHFNGLFFLIRINPCLFIRILPHKHHSSMARRDSSLVVIDGFCKSDETSLNNTGLFDRSPSKFHSISNFNIFLHSPQRKMRRIRRFHFISILIRSSIVINKCRRLLYSISVHFIELTTALNTASMHFPTLFGRGRSAKRCHRPPRASGFRESRFRWRKITEEERDGGLICVHFHYKRA